MYSPFEALVAGQSGNLGYTVEGSAEASSTVPGVPFPAVQKLLLGPNTPLSVQLYPYLIGDGYEVDFVNLMEKSLNDQNNATSSYPIVGTTTVRFVEITGDLTNDNLFDY